jgi:hypothetical protein
VTASARATASCIGAGFIHPLANVAVRLAGGPNYTAAPALWRLDQAMGGGKSHGLIGLDHLADDPVTLRQTDVGRQAFEEAERIPAETSLPTCVTLINQDQGGAVDRSSAHRRSCRHPPIDHHERRQAGGA